MSLQLPLLHRSSAKPWWGWLQAGKVQWLEDKGQLWSKEGRCKGVLLSQAMLWDVMVRNADGR